MSAPILIIEDDHKTASLVSLYLEREGFETVIAQDGTAGLERAAGGPLTFVILDLMLPGVDGWEICRKVRERSKVPILILSARGEEMDRVLGLSLGADDYLVKPFSPRELVARVKAVLRRTHQNEATEVEVLRHGGLELHVEEHRALLDGSPLSLTPSEFTILSALMSRPGRAFQRPELLRRLYPQGNVVVDRAVDVHVGNLRQKLEERPTRPHFIQTVRGIGYRFCDGTCGAANGHDGAARGMAAR